ncbi:hypothetical protein GCM10020358_84570 [Amorphoplanes nipponensis]
MTVEDPLLQPAQPVGVALRVTQRPGRGGGRRVGVGEGEVGDAVVDLAGQAGGVGAQVEGAEQGGRVVAGFVGGAGRRAGAGSVAGAGRRVGVGAGSVGRARRRAGAGDRVVAGPAGRPGAAVGAGLA